MSDEFFLVVGNGSMGRRRIRHLVELTDLPVRVYDLRQDRMDEVSAISDRVVQTDFATLPKIGLPKAIFISVPPAEHEFYIDWAIEQGLPFMVEQPITFRLENLARIEAGVHDKGLVAHISNNHRHSSEIATIEAVLAKGEIGRPVSAILERGEWLPDWHTYEPYQVYYPSRKAFGGGLDTVCDLDWMRYLFGEVVSSQSSCAKMSDLEIDTNDVMQFLFVFENRVRAIVHNDMLQRPYAAYTKIICENGSLTFRQKERALTVYNLADETETLVPFEDDRGDRPSMQGKADFSFVEPMYLADTRFFLDKLAAGDTSLDSLRSGIENLKVVHPLVGGV